MGKLILKGQKQEKQLKSRQIDLIHGNILPSLTGLALPIMATSLVQAAYNLTDMAWIGRVGSNSMAGCSHVFLAVLRRRCPGKDGRAGEGSPRIRGKKSQGGCGIWKGGAAAYYFSGSGIWTFCQSFCRAAD